MKVIVATLDGGGFIATAEPKIGGGIVAGPDPILCAKCNTAVSVTGMTDMQVEIGCGVCRGFDSLPRLVDPPVPDPAHSLGYMF